MDTSKTNNWYFIAKILLLTGAVVLFLSFVFLLFDHDYFNPFAGIDSSIASELGDYLNGFVGVFWSGAGLILIFVSIQEQKKQNDKVQFESSFFSMIDFYNELVNNTEGVIEYKGNSFVCKGRKYYSELLNSVYNINEQQFTNYVVKRDDIIEIKTYLKTIEDKSKSDAYSIQPNIHFHDYKDQFLNKANSKEYEIAKFDYVFEKNRGATSFYFKYIFNILHFILDERLEYHDEHRYIKLFQSHLSNEELALLYYFALGKNTVLCGDGSILYKWLNNYNFFENIDSNVLLKREHHKYYMTTFWFLNDSEKSEKSKKIV